MSISTTFNRTLALGACILTLGLGAARAADPYKIHAVLPLTGGAAFLGKGEQQALQLFEKLINQEGGIAGQPLEFVYHDDQTSPQTTVARSTRTRPQRSMALPPKRRDRVIAVTKVP